MRMRTDGIRRTQFREIILTDRKHGYVKGIFWSRTPYQARMFAKHVGRYLGFAARIRRVNEDKHINYIMLNWREV